MSKKKILIISGILLFIFIILMTIFSLKLFQEKNYIVNSLEVSLSEENSINTVGLSPTSYEDGYKLDPYTFTITNTSKNASSYKVSIKDIKTDKTKNFLKREQLCYQLILNKEVISVGSLSEIKNNILDSRSIDVGKVNKYELRIWILDDDSQHDWMNKYYNYNIIVDPVKA